MIPKHWCPHCFSDKVTHFTKTHAVSAMCRNCKFRGHVSLFLLTKPVGEVIKKKRTAGSGVIAGRIEIPGYRWGATRLG